jgi:hypothetical protein
MFDYDATGIEPSTQGQNKVLPKRWFSLQIIPFISKAGDEYPKEGYTKEKHYPKVDLLLEVIDDEEFNGERVFHSVTFMPKDKDGAGMAIHFLKTIGQPYTGPIKPDAKAWVGAKLMAYMLTEEYNGKTKNKIGEIKFYEPKKDGVPY